MGLSLLLTLSAICFVVCSLEEATGLAFRFVIGKTSDRSKMSALQKEVAQYDDFILLDIEEEYSKLPYKTCVIRISKPQHFMSVVCCWEEFGHLLQAGFLQSCLCPFWSWVLCESWWWHIFKARCHIFQGLTWFNIVVNCAYEINDYYYNYDLCNHILFFFGVRSSFITTGKREISPSDLHRMHEKGSCFHWSQTQMVSYV